MLVIKCCFEFKVLNYEMQEMIVYLYKLDAQMCMYTMSIVGQDMELALEV